MQSRNKRHGIYRVGSKEWPPYCAGKSEFFEVYHTLVDIIILNKPISEARILILKEL